MVCKSFSTSNVPKNVIIAMHGWTGDVNSMAPIASTLDLNDTTWLLPQAPYKTKIKGFSWYIEKNNSEWDCTLSIDLLNSLISKIEGEGFKKNSIFLLGFSQGACLAIDYMKRQSFALGGIIPVAGFIRDKKNFTTDISQKSLRTPVLLIHGKKDMVVEPKQSYIAEELLSGCGYDVDLHLFAGKHKFPMNLKNVVKNFITGD